MGSRIPYIQQHNHYQTPTVSARGSGRHASSQGGFEGLIPSAAYIISSLPLPRYRDWYQTLGKQRLYTVGLRIYHFLHSMM